MPNRIIKESICTSEDIAKLSQGAEILFYRLIVHADDYGRFFGKPSIVKSSCFPLLADELSIEVVAAWMRELEAAGLVILYTAEGRQYLQFAKWEKHQSIRNHKSKFPAPDEPDAELHTIESNCMQLNSIDFNCSRNPIQSNPNPDPIQCVMGTDEQQRTDKRKNFTPPTVEEVKAYCTERNNGIDPQRFVDYYNSRGWMLGKTKMKDWRAAVRTWERRDKDGSARNASGSTAPVQREWNIVYD